jgi:hypothetical protein
MNSGFKSDESPDLNTDGTAQAGEYVNAEGVPGFFLPAFNSHLFCLYCAFFHAFDYF